MNQDPPVKNVSTPVKPVKIPPHNVFNASPIPTEINLTHVSVIPTSSKKMKPVKVIKFYLFYNYFFKKI